MSVFLQPERLAYYKDKSLAQNLIKESGQLAVQTVQEEAVLAKLSGVLHDLPESHRDMWSRMVSRDLLLAATINKALVDPILQQTGDHILAVKPFGDITEHSLRDLLSWRDLRCAVALFPLASQSQNLAPSIGQAWVFQYTGMAAEKKHFAESLPRAREVGVFLESEGNPGMAGGLCAEGIASQFEGKSWELAVTLATKSLVAENASRNIPELATRWLLSGRVVENRVESVGLGNKLSLETNRLWMLPAANRADLPPRLRLTGKVVKLASHVDGGWHHVTGRGTTHSGEAPWPKDVDVFHTFTSKAYMPTLAAILFSRPRRIILWQSPSTESQEAARQLEGALSVLLPEGTRIEHATISSRDVAEAESALEKKLVDHDNTETVLFNLTNGNLLMRMAAGSMGQIFPFIQFIYRDVDNQELSFTSVEYDGLQAVTKVLAPEVVEKARSGMQRLLDTRPPREGILPWENLLVNCLLPEDPGFNALETSEALPQAVRKIFNWFSMDIMTKIEKSKKNPEKGNFVSFTL